VLHQRIAAATEARPDMRIVNIESRRTATQPILRNCAFCKSGPMAMLPLFNGLFGAYLAEAGKVDTAILKKPR